TVSRPEPAWNLLAESADVQGAKFEVPPGARWVAYDIPPDAFTADVGSPARPPIARGRPTVARFILDGPVLPLVTDTVRVAEAFPAAAMSRFAAWCRRQPPAAVERFLRINRPDRYSSPVLSGKDVSGHYLPGHDHAHY